MSIIAIIMTVTLVIYSITVLIVKEYVKLKIPNKGTRDVYIKNNKLNDIFIESIFVILFSIYFTILYMFNVKPFNAENIVLIEFIFKLIALASAIALYLMKLYLLVNKLRRIK